MPMGFKVLAWNVRVIARPGFKKNIKQLVKDHDPEIIIITESRVPEERTRNICEYLPYNSMEILEPIGFTGGVTVLRNSGVCSFTP